MIAWCTLIKHLFSKTGNVILHQEIIEVVICFGFRLQLASMKNDTGRTKTYRTYAVHEDKVYQKSLHLWWITLHSRNKYINSNTLKLPPIHIFKSLKLRQAHAVWNSTWWKYFRQQITTHLYWEILGQLLENHLLSLGGAWQWLPPWRECFLTDCGRRCRRRKGKEKKKKKTKQPASPFFRKTGNLWALLVEPLRISQLLSQCETLHESEFHPNTALMTIFFKCLSLSVPKP